MRQLWGGEWRAEQFTWAAKEDGEDRELLVGKAGVEGRLDAEKVEALRARIARRRERRAS